MRCFLAWCAERGLDPLAASRAQLELYVHWIQEVRRFKPSMVSRRRARNNLDRHPNYILAAYMASGT